jgi:hypothetical protein
MLMLERVGKSVDFPAEKFDILPTQGNFAREEKCHECDD